jgi:hypothetical protein
VIAIKDLIPETIKKIAFHLATDSLFDKYTFKLWQDSFEKVAIESGIITNSVSSLITKSSCIKRVFYAMFDVKKQHQLRELLILSISMEIIDHGINLDRIIIVRYVEAVLKCWYKKLIGNEVLRERFEKATGSNTIELLKQLDNEIESNFILSLANETELRRNFFLTYSEQKDYNEVIRVFLPNEMGYIDWKPELSVDIKINPFFLFELGFFRVGYDYRILSEGKGAWVVTLSKDRKNEVVSFGSYNIGKLTSKCIWAR